MEQYRSGELDEIYIIYTYMKNNSMTTETKMTRLLPFCLKNFEQDGVESVQPWEGTTMECSTASCC